MGSIADGDCGLAVACMLVDRPPTCANRVVLTEEISEYSMERFGEP